MDDLINVRETALQLLLGAQSDEVLNARPAPDSSRSATELASALKQAVNGFLATAVDSDGKRVDYSRLGQSAAYHAYRTELTPQLRTLDLRSLTERGERLAFWINLYNALVIDAVIAYGVQDSVTERMAGLAFFRCAAYDIGGQRFSCDDIEHGILRANRGNPFIPGPQFKATDPRQQWVLPSSDIRIHFALNCASRSCPPISVYTAAQIDAQLDLATYNFVAADTVIDRKRGEVHVSRIFDWYVSDFNGLNGTIDFLLRYLPNDERRAWLDQQTDIRLVYKAYDWGLNI